MRGTISSTITEIYMHSHEQTAIYMSLQPPNVWEKFVDGVYIIIKHTHKEFLFKAK